MSSSYNIHDMTIRFGLNKHYPCEVIVRSIGKTFVLPDYDHTFKTMCEFMNSTYNPREVYNSIIGKIRSLNLITDEELAKTAFVEYFKHGRPARSLTSDDLEELLYGIDGEVDDVITRRSHGKYNEDAERSRITKSKLGMTFWGALLVQDILS